MKCGGTVSEGQLTVCPAKETNCLSCKHRGLFTRICKSRRKNLNIIDSLTVNNTDCNYPLEQPDVNNNRVFSCGENCGENVVE